MSETTLLIQLLAGHNLKTAARLQGATYETKRTQLKGEDISTPHYIIERIASEAGTSLKTIAGTGHRISLLHVAELIAHVAEGVSANPLSTTEG